MASQFDVRLIAYAPYGAKIGPLFPQTYSATWTRYAWPVMQVTYSPRQIRFDVMESLPEIAVEVWDGSSWSEPRDCRFVPAGRQRDRRDPARAVSYEYHGIGSILDAMLIADETPQDPAEGPVRPVRIFTNPDAGDMMVPTYNAAVARVFTPYVAEPPTKKFQLDTDANIVAWAEQLDGVKEFDIDAPLSAIEATLIESGIAQPAWQGRQYQLYNFGTLGRDLTSTPEPVIIRDAYAVDKSPESQDYTNMAARILARGEDAARVWVVNGDADTSRGALEIATRISGSSTTAALTQQARALKVAGETFNEQLAREGVCRGPGPRPLRDWHTDDTVILQRGNEGARFVNRPCVELTISRDPNGMRWTGKFSDRHEDRTARALRRLSRLAHGIPGPGGTPSDPGEDVRSPAAPAGVSVTTDLRTGPNGETLADQLITWLPVTTDTDGQPLALRARGTYEIGERRSGGVIAGIAFVDGTGSPQWARKGIPPGARQLYVRAWSHRSYPSAWSTSVDGTVGRDDLRRGPQSLLDPQFLSADVRAQRQAAAGAGFTFATVSGRQVARWTSSTPVLPMGQGGTYGDAASGRVQVQPGEVYIVGGTHRRSSGSASAKARYRVRWYDAAGAATSDLVLTTADLTGTDQTDRATWTAPSGAVEAELLVTAVLAPSQAIEMHDPVFDRQAAPHRIQDEAVETAKIKDGAVVGGTGTGAKIAERTITFENVVVGTLTGDEIAADSIRTEHMTVGVELSAPIINAGEINGTDINGVTITGSEFRTTGDAIQIAGTTISVGSATIQFQTLVSRVAFSTGISVTGTSTFSSSVTISGGTFDNNGAASVNGSGTTLGFYGSTGSTKYVSGTAIILTNQASIIAAIKQIVAAINGTNLADLQIT